MSVHVAPKALLVIALFLASALVPFGSSGPVDDPALADVPPLPAISRVDGATPSSEDLVRDAAISFLVWSLHPADVEPERWTTVVLAGQSVHRTDDPSKFIFSMWDGVTWAICDNHPGYSFDDRPDGARMMRMIDGAGRLEEDSPGVSGSDLDCGLGPDIDGLEQTFRITAGGTEGLPIAWHGDLGIATL